MKRLLLATAIAGPLWVTPVCSARAQWAVIDISSIVEEMRIEWQAIQSYVTQVQQLFQEVQTATQMLTMVTNFVANPSFGAALGLMGMVGLNIDLPVNPYVVMSLMSGWGGQQSIAGLTGRLSGLGALVNTSYGNTHLYSCTDNSFSCQQSNQNGWSVAGQYGVLQHLYQGITDHNGVLNALREGASSPSPATREGTTANAMIENAWATGQAAQIEAVNGMAQAQMRVNAQQADEKWRSDADAYLQRARQ